MTGRSRPPSQTDILLKLIEEQGRQIRELAAVVREGHDRSSESRGKIHERIDEVVDRLAKLEGGIAILGQADMQVRGEVKAVAAELGKHAQKVQPAVEAWEDLGKLMKTGSRISLIFGISGITLLGWITGAGEWLWQLVRSRL